MEIKKAYKFELIPNGENIHQMKHFCGCSRFVFNKALEWQNKQYKEDNAFKFKYTKVEKLLKPWKEQFKWLNLCHSQVLQQSLKNLESSFSKFFKKETAFPKFKKKYIKDSFRFPQGVKLEENNNRIFLPKIGWIKYRKSRNITGTKKNVTISRKSNKWFVSIQTEYTIANPLPRGGEIDIDMGITRLVTLSNGQYFEPKNSFKNRQDKLIKLQRQLSHKKKFSNNWKKSKAKVSKLHLYIDNIRNDYLHKISTNISEAQAIVYVEDLKVRNMSKSSKGDIENLGKNVRAKSGLNRSILDQGWYEFRRQLEYKLLWNGGYLVKVNPRNTSRTCPTCQHIAKENRLEQSKFVCVKCGFAENADVVGAINVLRAGHAQLAK